ncbi:MAG: hypothetical protein ACJ79W_18530, partial [Myxococcales bacterium]
MADRRRVRRHLSRLGVDLPRDPRGRRDAAAAYKALRAQGIVSTDRRRGTRVLPRPSHREFTDT